MKTNPSKHRPVLLALTLVSLGTCALLAQNPEAPTPFDENENPDPFRKQGTAREVEIPPFDDKKTEPVKKEGNATDGSAKTGTPALVHDSRIYTHRNELPENPEAIVTFVVQFNHIALHEAERILNAVISASPGQASLAVLPATNSIVITGNRNMILKLHDLRYFIDVRSMADLVMNVVEIEHADPIELVGILNGILGLDPATGTRKSPESGLAPWQDTPIRIVAHPRTKEILIYSSKLDFLLVRDIIEVLNVPAPPEIYESGKEPEQ